MGYVKESLRNTAWYLFNELFHVRVNPNHVRTVEEIKRYGTPTTGNEDYDRELAKNDTLVMLNIAQMEDIFNNGYPVRIAQEKDTERIYKLITDHLYAMKHLLVGSENTTNDPKTMDELIRLDKFAASVFAHARYQMQGKEAPTSALAQRMGGGRFAALGKSIRQRASQKAEPAKITDPNKVHTTISSSGGRDYSSGSDHKPPPIPTPEEIDIRSPVVEETDDPRLPKRHSLETMFENQKRMGATNWR